MYEIDSELGRDIEDAIVSIELAVTDSTDACIG